MTAEAKHALALLELDKRSKKQLDEDLGNLKRIDDDPSFNQIIGDLRYDAAKKHVEQGMAFGDYLVEHAYLKKEFQDEIKKLDAMIKQENEKFDKAHKSEYETIEQGTAKADKQYAKRSKIASFVAALFWILGIGWVVTYFALIIVNPVGSTIHDLLYSGMMFFLFLPILGDIFLAIWVNSMMEDFSAAPLTDVKAQEKKLAELKDEKANNVSSLIALKEDYQYIIDVINFRTKQN